MKATVLYRIVDPSGQAPDQITPDLGLATSSSTDGRRVYLAIFITEHEGAPAWQFTTWQPFRMPALEEVLQPTI